MEGRRKKLQKPVRPKPFKSEDVLSKAHKCAILLREWLIRNKQYIKEYDDLQRIVPRNEGESDKDYTRRQLTNTAYVRKYNQLRHSWGIRGKPINPHLNYPDDLSSPQYSFTDFDQGAYSVAYREDKDPRRLDLIVYAQPFHTEKQILQEIKRVVHSWVLRLEKDKRVLIQLDKELRNVELYDLHYRDGKTLRQIAKGKRMKEDTVRKAIEATRTRILDIKKFIGPKHPLADAEASGFLIALSPNLKAFRT